MSKDSQLGLFSSPDKVEATPPSDVAIRTPASPGATRAAIVAAPDAMLFAKIRAPADIGLRLKGEAVAPAKPQADERYLSVQDVARRYAISIQTVWRHTKHNPDFPKPIKILTGSTRWRMSDILAFEISRQEMSQ
ncbi:putative DNA-binding transcriptional regulator AlpA [Rhizobium sp. BK181]|uniref:helix-turn-helix transcriptional regulator n=1 Tax=Rhizobium sp. BK181 TaxID=2587072 RepID=UPI0017E906A5|nr:hypothetical protein [Rhizobium sp. BK181]MBB3315518.1 putative DNA-binding transcriptional regulator AlpA [Rhizobium sp. BK181]